jgi:membrane-associated phospholipid phosphatase
MMELIVGFTNYMGDSAYLAISLALIFGGYLFSKYYRRQAVLLMLSLISLPYSVVLKLLFQQERPLDLIHKYSHYTEYYSFPSTHVVYFVAFWGFILYLCLKLGRLSKTVRIAAGALSFLLILMVGVSRVLVGAHYHNDVIAGYIFGGIFLAIFILLERRLDYPHIEPIER